MMKKTRAYKGAEQPAMEQQQPLKIQTQLKTWTRPEGVQIKHITREHWDNTCEHAEGDIDDRPVSKKPRPEKLKDLIGKEVWYSWRLSSNRDYYYYWSKVRIEKINSQGRAKVSDGSMQVFFENAYNNNWFLA